MSYKYYAAMIDIASRAAELERVIEQAANDEALTNAEYSSLYAAAIERIREPREF